jgi:CheY-like chemotaxis protein
VPKVIVVVDDNTLTRLLARDALVGSGYEVVAFASAREALDHIVRDVPAGVVVDHEMPGMDGGEFVRALRASADPRVRALPVVGVTARFEREMLDAGANGCVRKPFSQAGLAGALEAALGASASRPPGDVTSIGALLGRFRELHAEARAGKLRGEHRELYRTLRDDLARAFLAMQNLPFALRGSPRRHLRVPAVLPVVLDVRATKVQAATLDLGPGGFAATFPVKLERDDEVHFVLHVPKERPLAGRARVAHVTTTPAGRHRAGFVFFALPREDAERVELLVFDTVLAQLSAA